MGLGSLSMLPLAAARKGAADRRANAKQGIDPIVLRRRAQVQRPAENALGVTFKQSAEAHISDRESTWRNTRHAKQWTSTLATYAYPVIGDVDVRDIDTEMIVRILQPIWMKKSETARRVRGRAKAILDAEAVLGHRTGDNPARYADHLDGHLTVGPLLHALDHDGFPGGPRRSIASVRTTLDDWVQLEYPGAEMTNEQFHAAYYGTHREPIVDRGRQIAAIRRIRALLNDGYPACRLRQQLLDRLGGAEAALMKAGGREHN